MDLSGKLALITGGSRGIGAASAEILARRGAMVYINYREDEKGALSVRDRIMKAGGNAEVIRADVSDEKDVKAMFDRIGNIDILFNNAHCALERKAFEKMDWSDFSGHLDMSLKAVILIIKHALPGMKERRYGKIINNCSSVASGKPPAGLAGYVSSKSALLGLTRSLASELGRYGIRVNSISPGFTDTSMNEHFPDAYKELIAKDAPLGKICSPEEVAATVSFLAGPESDMITGEDIRIDGGLSMH